VKSTQFAISLPVLASAAVLSVLAVGFSFGQSAIDLQGWEQAAGGKMEFQVASIHLDESGKLTPPTFTLNSVDGPIPPGGRFHADFPLPIYIRFAYKLWPTPEQTDKMLAHLPKWVTTDNFVIDARAEGNPTKDQMGLMVRSLLADRFKLMAHFETRDSPVLAMRLTEPGKIGRNLKPHAQDPLCDQPSPQMTPGVFSFKCNSFVVERGPSQITLRSRNSTMAQVVESLSGPGRLGRPVVDETGLNGSYDYILNFAPESDAPMSPGAAATADSSGPTVIEALKDQLGLKLVPKTAPIQILVIDHVELPSPN
jgi:uncharacterized protein (TIGR03435 family)